MAARAEIPIGEGLLYEPRAFWDVQQIDLGLQASIDDPNSNVIVFSRENFRNGSRWPIRLDRISLAPVSYAFDLLDLDRPPALGFYHVAGDIIQRCNLLISAPQRMNLSPRRISCMSWATRPTVEPAVGLVDPNFIDGTDLFNVCRLDFPKPLQLPRLGNIQFDMGAPAWPGFIAPADLPRAVLVPFQILFNELGGLFGGSCRNSERLELQFAETREAMGLLPPGPFGAPQAGTGDTTQAWPATNRFRSSDYDRQETMRADGSNAVTGTAVTIDQVDYEDLLRTAGGAPAPVITQLYAPLFHRIPTRIRTNNGGTNEWWWRPGAPMSLVLNTITPALVYDLPDPITLSPGDVLEVELEVPSPVTLPASPVPVTIRPEYTIGVAFTGFAAIEG